MLCSQYSAVAEHYMDYDAIFHEIFYIRLSYSDRIFCGNCIIIYIMFSYCRMLRT